MRDFSFLKLPRNATEAFRTKTYSGVLCALEERSCNTAFALQGPEAVKTKQKRNQTLDWRGHTTARKNEVGRSGRGIQGKWEGGWMHASGGRQGRVPDFLFLFMPGTSVSRPYLASLPHGPSSANIPVQELTVGDGSSTPSG